MKKYICLDETCEKSQSITDSDSRFMFKHYMRHGRQILIELAQLTKVSNIPYQEPTYILADKLTKISKANSEEE